MQIASSTRSSVIAGSISTRRSTVVVKAGLFDFFKNDKELSIKTAAKKTVAKSVEVAPTKFAFPSLSLPFGGESEEAAAPKKPTVVKAKKPSASSLASLTRPKQGYVYEGNGKSGDREFSTVESMRTGKMRPENIDLNTPRSFWN